MASEVSEIHLVCRRSLNVSDVTPTHFTSGWWVVAERHIRPGVVFALHEAKGQPSYLQGRIEQQVGIDQEGRYPRVQVRIQRSPTPLPWKGGGSGTIGFLWAGSDFDQLPTIPTAIPEHLGGNNKALKSLLEAESFDYPMAPASANARSLATSTRRQDEFLNVLARLAAALDEQPIPYAFVDKAGLPWRLDAGAVRMAIDAGLAVAAHIGPDGRMRAIHVTEAFRRRYRDMIAIWQAEEARQREETEPTPSTMTPPPQVVAVDGPGLSDATDPFADLNLDDLPPEAFPDAVRNSRSTREGQMEFRGQLIKAYRGCAVTGTAVVAVLEAAHIIPYQLCGAHGQDVRNGLLLRADVHRLFDAQLLGFRVKGERFIVEVAPSLQNTRYGKFEGRELYLPSDQALWPSRSALKKRSEYLPLRGR